MEQIDTIGTLAALAHDTRLKVYRLLAEAGADGLRPKDIAAKLEVPPTSMSTHLAVLARAGVIDAERRGTAIIYRARPEKVRALARLLVEG